MKPPRAPIGGASLIRGIPGVSPLLLALDAGWQGAALGSGLDRFRADRSDRHRRDPRHHCPSNDHGRRDRLHHAVARLGLLDLAREVAALNLPLRLAQLL